MPRLVTGCVFLLWVGCGVFAWAQVGSASGMQASPIDLLETASRINRFLGTDVVPWHLRATYAFLNEESKPKGGGTYEIFWGGPRKIKQSYASKVFTQTDYLTETGLLRTGDMDWPAIIDQRVFNNLFINFPARAVLEKLDLEATDRSILGVTLHCIEIQARGGPRSQTAPTYCFDPGTPQLRYASGLGRSVIEQQSATLLNTLFLFRGHQVSRDITVACQGQPSLKIHIDVLEDLPPNSDDLFKAPSDALSPPPARQYIDQLHMQARILKKSSPAFGISNQAALNVKGMMDVIIGKDGVVKSVRPIAGPSIYESDEVNSLRKQTYQPVLVNGAPVEVETEVGYVFTSHH